MDKPALLKYDGILLSNGCVGFAYKREMFSNTMLFANNAKHPLAVFLLYNTSKITEMLEKPKKASIC